MWLRASTIILARRTKDLSKSIAVRIRAALRDVGLHPASHLSARQENAPAASQALQTDIGAQTDHDPIRIPTRMRFAQSQNVSHL